MQPSRILQAALLSLCFFAATTVSLAQSTTQVIYTGKLMGYFRSPSHQNRDATRGCSASDDSAAASQFEALRASSPKAILVGTGDNFAPELEARVFNKDAKRETNRPGNKELYYWSEDYKDWIYFDELKLKKHSDLRARLALGRATIPTDNVGCFLAGARFAAIVPGKHDFYFGPERLRELARFMASLSFKDMKDYKFDSNYRPPQMLGANLVIKTSPIEAPASTTSKPKSKWPDETTIKGLGDGSSVYPWFSSIVRVQVPSPSSQLIQKAVKDQFRQHEHADHDLLQKFLVEMIKKSTGVEQQEWIELQTSVGQQTDLWICPPEDPKLEYPKLTDPKLKIRCEGGWQIGRASLDMNVTAPASNSLLAQTNDWFSANKRFRDRKGFQEFLQKNVEDSKQGDKDDNNAWKHLSEGFSQLDANTIKVCPTNKLNEVAAGCPKGWAVQEVGFDQDDGITYSIRLVPRNDTVPILEPGWNYGLCQIDKHSVEPGIETKCQNFSVLNPFFSFPPVASMKGSDYKDPDPFVFIHHEGDPDPKHEVAIFGVVDPSITQQIGVLNYSWQNDDEKQKTVVSAEDPAEALKEQLDYFESWYQAAHNDRPFDGLKILLAQMSPQRARVLAARVKKFQMVVTEASEEQATSEVVLSTVWNEDKSASPFIAVPAPYYISGIKENVEGNVHFGVVDAERMDGSAKWKLQSREAEALPIKEQFMPKYKVADIIRPSLKDRCVDTKFLKDEYIMTLEELLKLATLCTMRQRLGADVALIQKRDLFYRVPASADTSDIQRLLDRLIWKGDLLTLMYVPGSALKKALDTSKKYDTEESDDLSLTAEKGRGLEYLGIKKNEKGEYLINEVPLEDNKVYAVATSDYIGAGDTGYPDLAAAALDPKTRAGKFPEKLELISAVVCRKLVPADAQSKCVSELPHNDYLDEIADTAPAQRKPGLGSKAWNLFPFKGPEKTPWKENAADALDKKVQQRRIWMMSLKNFSVTFNSLKNNHSDAFIEENFAGISTSGVNTKENHSIIVGLDLRVVRSKHNFDLFGATGIDYNEQSNGVANTTPNVVQNMNRWTGDVGVLWNLWGGRSAVRWGPVFTLHTETQLARPFTTFKLGTTTNVDGHDITDRLTISQNRSFTLLARVGLKSQNQTNMFEVGFETGREFNALKGYEFTNGVTMATCLPDAKATFATCISNASKANPPTITKDSMGTPLYEDRPRAGSYWKWNISIPFHEKVKFEITDDGDFFFADSAQNISTDTRFRDLSKSSLKFTVFPSFSIGPSLQLLLYRNKATRDATGNQTGGDFLSQKTFGFEASFSFNWFNRREAGVQIKHKP